MMKIYLTGLLTGLSLMMSPVFANDSAPEANPLIGSYKIIRGSRSGEELDTARLSEVRVRIDKTVITTLDRDEKEVYVASYQINDSRTPWSITMTAQVAPRDPGAGGTKTEGLIEVSNDTVKLIYALPGGKVPTDFETKEMQQMFVLRKMQDVTR